MESYYTMPTMYSRELKRLNCCYALGEGVSWQELKKGADSIRHSIVIGTKRVSGKKEFSQKINKQSTVLGL